MTANATQEWQARNLRRRAPAIDYAGQWTSRRWPDVEWRLAWNVGTGELYAVRCDDSDLFVLAIADAFGELEVALRGWGDHASRSGGLDWVIDQTRHLTGDGDVSLFLSRLRLDLTVFAADAEPLGRHGVSVEL